MNVKEKLNKVLLLAFVFLLPTQLGKHFFLPFSFVSGVRIDYLAPTIYLIDIIFVLLAIFYQAQITAHVKKNARLLLILGAVLVANIFIAPVPQMAIYTIARLIEVYFVYIIFAHERKKNGAVILYALIAGAMMQAILTTLQFMNKGSLQGLFYFFGERFFSMSSPGIATASLNGVEILRPYGTFSHPNSLGGFFLLLYAFALSAKPMKISHVVLAALSSFLVFFSFSKAAIGAFLLITITSALIQFVDRPLKSKKPCLPCLVSRILIPLVLGFLFFQAKGDTYSIDKRITLIEQALILFQQNPLFGVGFGNNLYLQAQFPSKYPEFFLQPVHNIFLLLMVQGGTIITALFTWIAFQLATKKRTLVFIAIIMTGLVDHYWLTLVQNMLLAGVVFGLLSDTEGKVKTIR